MLLLDGKKLNQEIASELREAISVLGKTPHLLIIKVGENEASDIYIQKKIEYGYNIGCQMTLKNFSEDTKQEEIINFIKQANDNDEIDGILVQLPLPENMERREVLDAVSIDKDVDGISSENLTRLKEVDNFFGSAENEKIYYIPVPVRGVISLLRRNEIEIVNKKVVVINDSNLIGQPIKIIFTKMGAEVELCNEETEDLNSVTKKADIVITAIGEPEMIDENYLSEGQVVIDVGISQTSDGVKGDVKKSLSEENESELILKAITPVPGGVGPMTVASLFQNLVKACQNKVQKNKKD